jgi:hypothetical protein
MTPLSVRHLIAAAPAALLVGLGPATPAAAPSESVSAFVMTPGRFGASVAALVALIGMVIGGLALARARRTGNGLSGGIVALVAGLIGMVLGGLIVATAGGGLGTGHGLGGGIVAVVVGLISVILGGLARARSHRTG